MKYNKPEITALGSAVNAIENHQKGTPLDVDLPDKQTITAYESDE
jgi:hypothetical protein